VPHISLVFREMWDATGLPLKPVTGRQIHTGGSHRTARVPYIRPTYAGANVGHPCRSVEPEKGLRVTPVGHPAIVAGIELKSSYSPNLGESEAGPTTTPDTSLRFIVLACGESQIWKLLRRTHG
jgi:hypothetical protein